MKVGDTLDVSQKCHVGNQWMDSSPIINEKTQVNISIVCVRESKSNRKIIYAIDFVYLSVLIVDMIDRSI